MKHRHTDRAILITAVIYSISVIIAMALMWPL